MKKLLLPTILLATLAIGVYFVVFQGEAAPEAGQNSIIGEERDTLGDLLAPERRGAPLEATEEELERQQLLNEHARPYDFVHVESSHRRNILGESIIEGTLTNQAKKTTYANFQIMIYFDKVDGMVLDSAAQMVFEVLKPGEKKEFKLKDKGPRKSEVRVRLVDATVQ